MRAGWPRRRGAERLDRFGPHTAIAVPRHEHDEAVAVTHLQPPVGFDIPQRRGAHRVVAAVERQVDTVRPLAVAKAEYGAELRGESAAIFLQMRSEEGRGGKGWVSQG